MYAYIEEQQCAFQCLINMESPNKVYVDYSLHVLLTINLCVYLYESVRVFDRPCKYERVGGVFLMEYLYY